MKKLFALLMTLCMLCTAAAVAETPTFAEMPALVTFDSFFEGTWTVSVAFAGTEYVDLDALAALYGVTVPTVTIGEGTVAFVGTSENGEAVTEEYPYMLENSQMLITDDEDMYYVFELLEDGNITMSTFVPGEGEGLLCITMFLVRTEE